MESLKNLTPEQEIVLQKFLETPSLVNNFYFTGGTALSSAYLQHRHSDDLDFFTETDFDNFLIQSAVQKWADDLKATFELRNIDTLYMFTLKFPDGASLKVDFAYYPYKQLESPQKIEGITIDSIKDIAVNKLVTLSQRTDVKDFVDLYFLIENYGVFELLSLSNTKFRRNYDVLLLASDFLKVTTFDYLPRMTKRLELNALIDFYTNLARKIGLEATQD